MTVQQQSHGRGQRPRVGQERFHGSPQTPHRPPLQQPATALGGVRGDLLAGRIPEIPQLAFQVNERHGRPLPGWPGVGRNR